MNVQKVEKFNGGGNCNYALIWELDKFIVVGENLVTIWAKEEDYFAELKFITDDKNKKPLPF